MSKTIEELRADAQRIKNETGEGKNTANRVGGLFEDIVDVIDDYHGDGSRPAPEPEEGNAVLYEPQNASDYEKVAALNNLHGKAYNAAKKSGLGKVYLDKNNGLLTQEMMNAANTCYVIMFDYDLDGEEIQVPEGCVLEFDGGSVSNGFVYGNGAKLIGGNKYKSVLIGTFKNEGGVLVNGTGNPLTPDVGFDFAANRMNDVDYENGILATAQGIIHTGNRILVLCNISGTEHSIMLRYDNFFNYYGYVKLPDNQVAHGGQGYYKDGYVYIASHIGNFVVKYSLTAITQAESGTELSGTVVEIESISDMNVIYLSYDYNSDTVLMASGSKIAILDKDYNLIIEKSYSVPSRIGYYLQDLIWDNGIITFSFTDSEYSRDDNSVVYYDIYSGAFSSLYRLPYKYTNVEVEGSCPYIGHDGMRLICGNNAKKGAIIIGKFSNTTEVDTLDKGMVEGYATGTLRYVDNANVTPQSPIENEIVVPNGSQERPFKNITSAHYFNKSATLSVRFTSFESPYYLPLYMDSRVEIAGSTTNRPTIKGDCLMVNGTLRLLYVDYYGHLSTEYSTLDIYQTTVDGTGEPSDNPETIAIKINRLSTLLLNRSTVKNATTGIYFDVGAKFHSDCLDVVFENLATAIYVYSSIEFNAQRLHYCTFTDVEKCIDCGFLESTFEFIVSHINQYTPFLNMLDKSAKGIKALVYCPADINDRPKGVCTFMHKDDVSDTKGTLIGPNGSTLPTSMSSHQMLTTIARVLIVGDHTFNTDLGKIIYWDGEKWVDATGTEVTITASQQGE